MVWLTLPPGEALPHRSLLPPEVFFFPSSSSLSLGRPLLVSIGCGLCWSCSLCGSVLSPYRAALTLFFSKLVSYLWSLTFGGEMVTVAIQGSVFWISLRGGFVGALSLTLQSPLLAVSIGLVY